jgi:hypothetical protein
MSDKDNELTDEISEDIASLYEDNTESDSESNVQRFIESKLPDLPVDTQEFMSSHPVSSVSQDLAFSADEGHVYYTAYEYYKSVISAAKKYNKWYCKQTRQKIKGKRTLKKPDLGLKYAKEFNPFVYELVLEKRDMDLGTGDIVPNDAYTRQLRIVADTAEEATVRMAMSIGFDNEELKAVESKFHAGTIQKIKTNPKYLDAARFTLTSHEHIKQVKEADYVHIGKRQEWLRILEEDFQKQIQNIRFEL